MPDVTRLVGQLLKNTYRVAWKARDDEELQDRLVTVLDKAIEQVDGLVVEE